MTTKQAISVFSKDEGTLQSIGRKIRRARSVCLFLDYDGTLTPIRQHPAEARLSPETKALLAQLRTLPGVSVFVITGRSMTDIRRCIRLPGIVFAANHGLHIRYGKGDEWIHPSALASRTMLTRLRHRLRPIVTDVPGAFVEHKGLTLSIHFRNSPQRLVSGLRRAVTACVRAVDPTLRMTKGKKVMEIRPGTPWEKSDAVATLVRTTSTVTPSLAIYIGDDTTDENALRAVRPAGISVHVGRSVHTAAQYYVKDVREVLQFMQFIRMLRLPDLPRSDR